jgi:hypothetical protein
MTKEELVKKYPKIFSTDTDPRYPIRMFGIECGSGWVPLLDNLCSSLQFDTDHNNSGGNEGRYPQVVASQVKEKFGQLCFYVHGANDHQYGEIRLAEAISSNICEHCGKFSLDINTKANPRGWLVTLCDECYKERYEEDKG